MTRSYLVNHSKIRPTKTFYMKQYWGNSEIIKTPAMLIEKIVIICFEFRLTWPKLTKFSTGLTYKDII